MNIRHLSIATTLCALVLTSSVQCTPPNHAIAQNLKNMAISALCSLGMTLLLIQGESPTDNEVILGLAGIVPSTMATLYFFRKHGELEAKHWQEEIRQLSQV